MPLQPLLVDEWADLSAVDPADNRLPEVIPLLQGAVILMAGVSAMDTALGIILVPRSLWRRQLVPMGTTGDLV